MQEEEWLVSCDLDPPISKILRNYERKSGWSYLTYVHDLHNYLKICVWSQYNYVREFTRLKTLKGLLLQNFHHCRYGSGNNNGWSYETNILYFITPYNEEWLQGNYLRELDGVREVGHNVNSDRFVYVIVLIAAIGTPHGVPLLAFFCGVVAGRGCINKKEKKII